MVEGVRLFRDTLCGSPAVAGFEGTECFGTAQTVAGEGGCRVIGASSLAIISDIHGNVVGLRAVLESLDRLAGANHQLVVAGDVLTGSSGADDLMNLLVRRGAEFVRGNMEALMGDLDRNLPMVPERYRLYASNWIQWLCTRLSPDFWNILTTAPLTRSYQVGADQQILVCHAVPTNPWERACGSAVSADVLRSHYGNVDASVVAYGHFHRHHVIPLDGRLLVNVASVGLRKDETCALTIVEPAGAAVAIRQYTIPYSGAEEQRLNSEACIPDFEQLVGAVQDV
jgi:predicted phosphodiesterase